MKPSNPPQYPVGGLHPDSVVISHGHLDHCGLVPNLMDLKPDIFMTPVTRNLSVLLARDTMKIARERGYVLPFVLEDIRDFELNSNTIDYDIVFEASGYEIRFYNAGHIPGSASIYLENESGSLIYTGDINNQDTYLLGPAWNLPVAETIIIESTYFNREHTPRPQLDDNFISSIEETVDGGGWALVPAFAIGRTQEVLMILAEHGITAWVDGMGVDVYEILKKDPDYIKDPVLLDEAFKNADVVRSRERKKVLDKPGVIVTTAGMLNGGPALYYLKHIYNDPRSKVLLSGYQIEGTNGRTALENGYYEDRGKIMHLKAQLELFDFSAHSGDKGLKAVLQNQIERGCENVICIHGDNTQGFASWIKENLEVNAIAPDNGDLIHL
jgi:putative mRNA 3-end processing factor